MTFVALLTGLLALAASETGAAETGAIDARTPWRAYLVQGMNILRERGTLKIADSSRPSDFDPANFDPLRHKFSPLPPAGWNNPSFDDGCWARYQNDDLADFLGEYGAVVSGKSWATLLYLRTSFGIDDPAAVKDLKLSVTCLGGAVVYVNGREVGRGFMPAGKVEPFTPAEDYDIEAYTTEDGRTALPVVDWGAKRATPPEAALLRRYERRVRSFDVEVPAGVLVKGRNVLAVELHRAAAAGPMTGNKGWSHLGFHAIKLTSETGGGVVPYAQATKDPYVWSAANVDQITDSPPAQSLIRRSWFWTMYWDRGMPVKGVQFGNPFEALRPVRMAAPRNGVASGQVVISDVDGLREVSASIEDMKGPGTIPSSAVQVRYARQHAGLHYCDALAPEAPRNARTVPVWLIVQVPRNAAPGWYTSTLSIRANGKSFTVPVHVMVSGFVLPDARDLDPQIGMTHSPETLAMHYGVEPFSDAHWKLMARSFELMGQIGNDVVHVPVILGGGQPATKGLPRPTTNPVLMRAPLVRWVKAGDSVKPEFSLLEKYLDEYLKHCAPPQALSLYIWDAACASELADAYENRRIASRVFTPKAPLTVALWDPATGQTSEIKAPAITDEGAESFYRPLLEGVRQIVTRRGWSERIIMLSLGGDFRPGQKSGELMRQWAPYARWNILSHFSGDPGPRDGRMIATGELEVGLKEWPAGGCLTAARLEERILTPGDSLELPTIRWQHQEYSPPMLFRTLPLQWNCMTRVGLDFWLADNRGPKSTSFFSHINALTVPGPDGATPTVRFQLFREGVQDAHLRSAIIKAYAKLPEEQRKPYRALVDEFAMRAAWSSAYLSQHELSFDWPSYAARLQQAAAELAGAKDAATWSAPPR